MRKSLLLCLFTVLSFHVPAATLPSNISATHTAGQTFITWHQPAGDDLKCNVYRSTVAPIDDIAKAEFLGSVGSDSSLNRRRTNMEKKDRNTPGPNIYFRLPSGRELKEDQGLLVWTTQQDANAYYAVTVADSNGENHIIEIGKNATAKPLEEKIALPEPVFQQDAADPYNREKVKMYVFWPNWKSTPLVPEMTNRPGQAYNFVLRNPNPRKRQMLFMSLPGIGGNLWGGSFKKDLADDECSVHFFESTHNVGYYFGWNENFTGSRTGNFEKGTVHNYNQRYIIYITRWAARTLNINQNRVYLGGISMGSIGTANIGFSYPNLFAAIYIYIPRLYVGDPLWLKETKEPVVLRNNIFERQWSKFSANLPTSDIADRYPAYKALTEGFPIYDRTNQIKIVSDHPEIDLPVCIIACGKRDWTVGWTDKPPFIRAMESSRHQMFFYWMTGDRDKGHNSAFHKTIWPAHGLDPARLRRYALDQSYPAINNLAINDNPGDGLDMMPDQKPTGDPLGTINGYVDWEPDAIKDTPDQWRVKLFMRDVVDQFDDTKGIKVTTADITPRRLQNFKVEKGKSFTWKALDAASGELLNPSRQLTADSSRLITMKNVKITRTGTELILTHK